MDALEGLTAAIIVDQERMCANSRSTVGTATDAYDMLRVIFSRLGEPHIGPSTAFSFNVPAGSISGQITLERGRGETDEPVERLGAEHPGLVDDERCAGRQRVRESRTSGAAPLVQELCDGVGAEPGLGFEDVRGLG